MVHYQFERTGYFCLDSEDSGPDALVFNRVVTLRDNWSEAAPSADSAAATASKTPSAPAGASPPLNPLVAPSPPRIGLPWVKGKPLVRRALASPPHWCTCVTPLRPRPTGAPLLSAPTHLGVHRFSILSGVHSRVLESAARTDSGRLATCMALWRLVDVS